MYVIEKDVDSGMKLGISNKEYYIYFKDQWNKLNIKSIDEAKRIFHKVCFDHEIDEAKRLNKFTF